MYGLINSHNFMSIVLSLFPFYRQEERVSPRKVSLPCVNPMIHGRVEIQNQVLSNQVPLTGEGTLREVFPGYLFSREPLPAHAPQCICGKPCSRSLLEGSLKATEGTSGPCFSFLSPTCACNQSPTNTEEGGFGLTALKVQSEPGGAVVWGLRWC